MSDLTAPSPSVSPQAQHLQNARESLATTLSTYQNCLTSAQSRPNTQHLQAFLQQELDKLAVTLDKLDRTIVRIAVFGLVSRGKSAVLNAVVGSQMLETGPLNGVTRQVQVVEWSPEKSPTVEVASIETPNSIAIELLDTPGLDEVDGEARALMAADVAAQCDLILFIVAGAITRVEYDALRDLRQAQKPLLLVFNKIDLYPEQTRDRIYQNLLELSQKSQQDSDLQQLLTADEIVLIAADPAAEQVRIETPGGKVDYVWEKAVPAIAALQEKILTVLNREGRSLLALNALTQSRNAETKMAAAVIENRQADAEALIWKFTRYKAIAVGLNPFGFLDFVGGAIADLTLIRQLANLYGLPMTRYEAGDLLKTILISSGGLLASELLSWILLSLAKGAIVSADSANIGAILSVGLLQAGVAGYGSYIVGRAAQVYLEQGCTWGEKGASSTIQQILSQVDRNAIVYRIREELM